MKWYELGTGLWTTLFGGMAMTVASLFFWFRPEQFGSGSWLSALATCAGLYGGVILKRTVDNSKLAKDGVGDYGK